MTGVQTCALPIYCAEVEALFGFSEKVMADKAYEVDANMVESDVVAEEDELSRTLKSQWCL